MLFTLTTSDSVSSNYCEEIFRIINLPIIVKSNYISFLSLALAL